MHRGPLLAYLMADPELSLQGIRSYHERYRPAQGLGLCRLGGPVQHGRRSALRRVGGRASPWLILGGTAVGLAVLVLVLNRLAKGCIEDRRPRSNRRCDGWVGRLWMVVL